MLFKLIKLLLFFILAIIVFKIENTDSITNTINYKYHQHSNNTYSNTKNKMKSWRNMAIDLIKEEQAREDYRNNNFTIIDGSNKNDSSQQQQQQQQAIVEAPLYTKLKRQYSRYYRFKVKDTINHQYLMNYFIQTEFDKDTMDFIMETPRWNFVSNAANWIMSWMYTKTDIMGFIGKGNMMCLSTYQYKQILKINRTLPTIKFDEEDDNDQDPLKVYYESLLDIGAGCGSTTLSMKPLFKNVTATEASKGMIYSLNKKGIDSVFCLDLETCDQLKNKQYDIVSCLNVLDRCEKPISLLNTIKKFLKPNGKLILAVVFPFNPYVEFGGIDNSPIETINLDQETLSEYVDSFNKQVFIPNNFEIDSFTVGPYISEGDALYQNYVLTDVIFVLKVKNEDHSNNKISNDLMSCD
ncbi:hypothetical protein DDB_G0281259 [Dictyostelium discoideum AX4]|uniref:DREV methyltransferase n=1 Tax=Dictyostelium discoideum TaxID=44689 RepID=Q54U59_DICDI|nr:hypothetical protein DDB_G0281259 [Dictyostelium discoideum AX4]EAL66926.2 hypothetical protein DDB_G0281259 [Dictyostelium discoideum AX4]|eukprot:XP_640917.2 hypothetical protein DDB_G0281259 [Dictyostelium discoideum AX4]